MTHDPGSRSPWLDGRVSRRGFIGAGIATAAFAAVGVSGCANGDDSSSAAPSTLPPENGSFTENGGATKPIKIDADQTTYQMVTDVSRRQVWLKVCNPKYFADWTPVDLSALWAGT